jgi:homospermidine synthase
VQILHALEEFVSVYRLHPLMRDDLPVHSATDGRLLATVANSEGVIGNIDELGVLLYGHARNAYWYGSQLSIEETRRLAPHQNATGLQVTSAVLAGIVWMLENPDRGIVEADEIDLRRFDCSGPISVRDGRYTD